MANTQFITNMHIHRMRLCRYSDLTNPEILLLNEKEPFNLYMILKGKKIILDPEKSELKDNGELILRYEIHSKGEYETRELALEVNQKYLENTILEIKYPYKQFTLLNGENLVSGGFLPAVLRRIREAETQDRLPHEMEELDGFEFLDLELLYIGQAKGKKKESTAIQRLMNHSTFQKILALENENDTDCEIYIGLLQFEIISQMLMIPGSTREKADSGNPNPVKTLQKLASTDKFRGESINIAEAALIKYFEPKYNLTFSDNLTSEDHISYKFFYDNNIHSVMIEFFPYARISSRVSTMKRKSFSCGFITYQISGNSATLGPLTIPSDNEEPKL